MAFELTDFEGLSLSAAMTADLDRRLGEHLHPARDQEDLAFAYWRPSVGLTRYTAVVSEVVWPRPHERILRGNVSFLGEYVERVLAGVPAGAGVALLHGHLGPGWQDMSQDDVRAEQVRLAGAVAGRTGLPVLGLTRGTDGAWSARLWLRSAPRIWDRRWADSVRVVGRSLAVTRRPGWQSEIGANQVATASAWGREAQSAIAATRVAIVGLGSVGSLVAEALARTGVRSITYVDFDRIETRNLDRTLGAAAADVAAGLMKVQVALRAGHSASTAARPELRTVPESLLSEAGLQAVLDADVVFSCVDRPLPRHVLNALALGHLIPVIDGGILVRVRADGRPLHVDWRIHAVGPERTCLVCLGAVRRSDIALDRAGLLDDPDYIAGLSEQDRSVLSRRNVFSFSMSVAAHEILQFVGVVTGLATIGGTSPQAYHAYPGTMSQLEDPGCEAECEYVALTAQAPDLRPNIVR
jgi:hypothetical protein